MKLLDKSYLFGLMAAAMTFTACGEYEDDYTPGSAEKDGHAVVYFPADAQNDIVLGVDDKELTVKIAREDAAEALEVPLRVGTASGEYFSVPSSVKFEAGEAETEITVGVSDELPMFETRNLSITVPEDYRVLYGEQDASYSILLNVLKEDYVPVALGVFSSEYLSGTFGTDLSYEMELEYSPLLDLYRLADPWYVSARYCLPGYNLTFKWNKETNEVAYDKKKYETGFLHPNYGMVTAESLATVYRPASQLFLFQFNFTVGAGSFGSRIESFQITETY